MSPIWGGVADRGWVCSYRVLVMSEGGTQVAMGYSEIDPIIDSWVERHVFTLFRGDESQEARCIYVSSAAGECFQIWIAIPVDGFVSLHAAGVEGRRDHLPPKDWCVPVHAIESALENAFDTVKNWMAPSLRHFPFPIH